MKWNLITAAGLILVVVRPGGDAAAQYINPSFARPVYSPYARPALSPYLDLLRGGNPAANYYLGVLPELDRRATDTAFRSAILDLDRRTALIGREVETIGGVETLAGTGHAVQFLSFYPYYNIGAPSRSLVSPLATSSGTVPSRPSTPSSSRPSR
jgi:hypothetical protein